MSGATLRSSETRPANSPDGLTRHLATIDELVTSSTDLSATRSERLARHCRAQSSAHRSHRANARALSVLWAARRSAIEVATDAQCRVFHSSSPRRRSSVRGSWQEASSDGAQLRVPSAPVGLGHRYENHGEQPARSRASSHRGVTRKIRPPTLWPTTGTPLRPSRST
jgi:hypothetical protein